MAHGLSLRINGIPPPSKREKETGEDCLQKVKKVFNGIEVDIPDSVLDRSHRIGRPQTVRGKTLSFNDCNNDNKVGARKKVL